MEVLALLRAVEALAACDDDVLAVLAADAVIRRLPAGKLLYREGDDADSLAVVASGRLLAVVASRHEETVVASLGPGAVIGELALLARSRRGASVRALRDSTVVELSASAFDAVVETQPRLARALAGALAQRLQRSADLTPPDPPTRVFAVVGAAGAPVGPLADGLRAALSQWDRVACFDRTTRPDDLGAALAPLDRDGSYVLLVVDDEGDASWRGAALGAADEVVVALGPGATPAWAPELGRSDVTAVIDVTSSGREVAGHLDPIGAKRRERLRLREPAPKDVARLARRLTRRSVGLVLSGGGARGLAHIGVIAGLLDHGVAIDRVGGCSMGALIGSLWASGLKPEELVAVCRRELVGRRTFSDYTLPRVALLRARRATAMLERLLGPAWFEDLERSAFAVSADLATGGLTVHERGPVVPAVAASMAVPGLVPPVAVDGRWLVDGGVLDNLPIDVMAAQREGPVLAVDVVRRPGDREVTARRPSIVEVLTRATVMGSLERADRSAHLAHAVIRPDVSSIGLLDFERIDEAVDAGRAAASSAAAALPTNSTSR